MAASGRGDEAFTWIQAVEKDGSSFENLGKSGTGYETLDAKLASALVKTCDGSNLSRDITAKTEQEAKDGRNIKGRQILWMIYEYFRSNELAWRSS